MIEVLNGVALGKKEISLDINWESGSELSGGYIINGKTAKHVNSNTYHAVFSDVLPKESFYFDIEIDSSQAELDFGGTYILLGICSDLNKDNYTPRSIPSTFVGIYTYNNGVYVGSSLEAWPIKLYPVMRFAFNYATRNFYIGNTSGGLSHVLNTPSLNGDLRIVTGNQIGFMNKDITIINVGLGKGGLY